MFAKRKKKRVYAINSFYLASVVISQYTYMCKLLNTFIIELETSCNFVFIDTETARQGW